MSISISGLPPMIEISERQQRLKTCETLKHFNIWVRNSFPFKGLQLNEAEIVTMYT